MDGLRADASIDPCWFRGGGCRVDDGGGSGVFPLIVFVVAVVAVVTVVIRLVVAMVLPLLVAVVAVCLVVVVVVDRRRRCLRLSPNQIL